MSGIEITDPIAALVIASRDGREILRLAFDGTLTLDVEDADEAAKIFIECVSYQMAAHGANGLGLPVLLDAAAREARAAAIEECAKVGGKFLMENTGLAVEYVVELEAALRALREQALSEGND